MPTPYEKWPATVGYKHLQTVSGKGPRTSDIQTSARNRCLSHPSPNKPPSSAILDHADRRIRRYISAKQKLIALLLEEKQAIISQAVTRGLDPNVPLKPSGVEWLGDVPEHWEVMKLARVVHSSNAGEVIDKGWWGRGISTSSLHLCVRQALLRTTRAYDG